MPHPPSNTDRVFLTYATANAQHVIENRYTAEFTDIVDVIGDMAFLLSNINDFLYEITIVKVEFSAAGSDVRLPADWTGDATYGATAEPAINAPRQFTITGKDNLGVRWRSSLFGVNISTPTIYRLPRADANFADAWLGSVSTVLADWLSIAGNPIFYNQYVNVGFNDHWVATARG